MNHTNVKVVAKTDWVKQGGLLPCRVIVWNNIDAFDPAKPYVTHIECNQNDTFFFHQGHYGMDLKQAMADFQHRWEQINPNSSVPRLTMIKGGN